MSGLQGYISPFTPVITKGGYPVDKPSVTAYIIPRN